MIDFRYWFERYGGWYIAVCAAFGFAVVLLTLIGQLAK